MTRTLAVMLLVGSLIAATPAISQEATSVETNAVGRYMACENPQGGGFYWVDTTSGKLWFAELGKENNDWKFLGQVKDAKVGVVGTYIPFFKKKRWRALHTQHINWRGMVDKWQRLEAIWQAI